MGTNYEQIEAKGLMRLHDTVDDWWWNRNSMNIYRGCEHACNYCDGRSHRYHVHDDFDQTVQVKVNAPALLEKELAKLGYISARSKDSSLAQFGGEGLGDRYTGPPKFVVAVGGGVSDSYQPAEKRFGLTRKVLEVLRDFQMPVSILTKSDLVLRDLDILEEINARTYANVSFTVTTMDETVRELFEPKAATTESRLRALADIRDRGIHGGLMLMPIIPVVGDSEWAIEEVVRSARSAKAECVQYCTMSMRAEQRDRMFELLGKHFPKAVERYEGLYSKGDWPDDNYTSDIYLKAHSICVRNGMPERMARYIPEGALANNLKVCEVLCNMAYFMQLQDIRIEKVKAYRTAGHAVDALKDDVAAYLKEDKLKTIDGVGNIIAKDIEAILRTGTCPLYESLRK